jgi:hypothetical protein
MYVNEFRPILVLTSQPKNYDRHIRSSENEKKTRNDRK